MNEGGKLVREIEAELKREWQGEAFKWADEKMHNAHAEAVDRFDRAILQCTARSDWVSLKAEGDIFKESILKIFRAYKREKAINESTSFLDSLRYR